ncbi:MAG: FtsX-like permease family protein, partial [Gemmatimonadota bacterium]
ANLANLFLADATARQREWTVRLALGASRGRLVRERLVASLLLAGLGGLAGLLIAEWGVAILQAMAPTEIGVMIDPSPDIRVLGFTAAISLLTGIAFGVGPVLFSTQTDLAGGLRAGGKGAGDAPGRRRTRGILVVAEVSLALVLAIGAVLLGKTFTRVQGMQTGLDPDRLLTIGLVLPAASYPTTASRALFADRVLNQMKQVNGVTSTSVVSRLALAPGSSTRSIALEGSNGSAGLSLEPDYLTAGPDYLRSMGITLQAGREFTANDRDGAPAVAMISQAMARKLWPSASAIGQRFRIDGDTAWREVVGVTADVRQRGFDRAPRPTFYVPFAQDPWTRLTVVVRARSSVVEIQRNAAAAIQGLDRDLAVSDIRPMTEVMAASLTERRFNLTLIGLFAGSALLLAIVGVYGVISYTVTQRTREVGIRMAIGAESRQIVAMIVRQGGGLAGAGILIGIAGSVLLAPVLRGMLFDITPTDLATYAEVSGVVMLVALAACYQPARRVTRVDPAIVLRSE